MAVLQHIRFVCAGGVYNEDDGTRYTIIIIMPVNKVSAELILFLTVVLVVGRAFVHSTRLFRCRGS